MKVFTGAFMLSVLHACYGGEERLWNVTYLFLKFLMVKMDPLNRVSHNVAVYKNVNTTLNAGLLYFEDGVL
jgi:hypothetical protein